MDRAEFAKIWNVLAIAYPGSRQVQAGVETTNLYYELLGDLPAEMVRAAALRHIKASTFFPAVAELMTSATDVVYDNVQSAAEAWGDVVRNKSAGPGHRFDNPFTQRAIDALGGLNICNGGEGSFGQSHPDHEHTWRARFMAEYDRLVAQARQRATESQLETDVRRQLSRPLEPGARLSDPADDVARITAGVARKLTGGGNGQR